MVMVMAGGEGIETEEEGIPRCLITSFKVLERETKLLLRLAMAEEEEEEEEE